MKPHCNGPVPQRDGLITWKDHDRLADLQIPQAVPKTAGDTRRGGPLRAELVDGLSAYHVCKYSIAWNIYKVCSLRLGQTVRASYVLPLDHRPISTVSDDSHLNE